MITDEKIPVRIEKIRQGSSPINKTRYKIPYGNFTLEIDVYPEWKNQAIMEVELPSESSKLEFPDFVELIKEVTGSSIYTNSSLANSFPREEAYL